MRKAWLFFLLFPALSMYGHEYRFSLLPADFTEDIQQISVLFQSSDRLMWLGTDKGLFSFDGRKYTYHPRPDHKHQKVTAISQAEDGWVWAGYEDGQIITTKSTGQATQLDLDSLAGFAITKIIFSAPKDVLVATYGLGLWQIHDQQLKRIQFDALSALSDIYDAALDTRGQLWLGTDDGIWVYRHAASPSLQHIGRPEGLQDDIITHLTTGNQGNMLIGMYDFGVAQFNGVRNEIQDVKHFKPEDGNPVSLVHGFGSDVWVATEKAVWYASRSNPTHQIILPFALKNRIETIYFDVNGNLWLASGNHLYIANTQIDYVRPTLTGIQAVLRVNDQLWYGCQNGLYSSDLDGQHVKQYLKGEKINVLSLYRDADDFLWVGTFGQGLYIFDPVSKRTKHLTERDKLSNTSILNMDGRSHQVWLATLGGITQIAWAKNPLESSLVVTELQDQFESPPGYVYSVFVSAEGKVWFGTDGKGLFYLGQHGIQSFPVSYAENDSTMIPLKTVYSITEDWEHRLWISTAKGQVMCVDTAGQVVQLIRSPNGSINSVALTGTEEVIMIGEGIIQLLNSKDNIFILDETTGLSSFTPNINAISVDPDGSVWIADSDLILHYVSYVTYSDRKVKLLFEDFSPGSVLREAPLILRPDSNFLDVQFAGIWYQDPTHIRYRYMLQGHDQDWIYTREGRAVYSRLSAGEYTFLLQGSHHDDFSQSETLRRSLLVLPPIYLRWWFILGLFMLVALLIYWFIQARIIRISKLHALEKEKTTLQLHAIQAQVNPHFLFNSFNTLSSIIEEDQQAAVAYVDQLSSFFRGALMHRHDDLIPLTEEMDIVRNYMYILKKRYGENIHIEEHITNLAGWIAPLSIQLLVENAIKHNTVSSGKHLTIKINIDQHWVEVSNPIQPKFQSQEESTGFGLSSLLTRYTYLTSSKIEIIKEPKRFTVKIPVIYAQ